jgi:hypothetical protein
MSILEVYQFVTGLSATTNKQSGVYLVRCPVSTHEDRHPSCSLNARSDSWKCFACDGKGGKLKLVIASGKARTNAEAAAYLKGYASIGHTLTFKEQPALKAKHARGEAEQLVDEKRVAVHSYTDDQGRTVYQVIRYEGKPAAEGARSKRFSQRLIGPDGKWIWVLKGQKFERWPYLMQDVQKAAREHKVLVALEGEKHCDALRALDIYTTTLAEGWKALWEPWWNQHLDGIPLVFVLADADKVGREAADKRAKAMASPERKAAVLDIFPERTNGDDILNWMIEEDILVDIRDVDKLTVPLNWKKLYRIPLAEARERVIAKLTACYHASTKLYGDKVA